MSYWILITSKENWDIINQKNIWGISESKLKIIKRTKVEDKCLIYVRQQIIDKKIIGPEIVGDYLVESDVYYDKNKIFKISDKFSINETFPYRVQIKRQKNFKNPIDFKSLIPSLSFITNKKFWSTHLQGSPM